MTSLLSMCGTLLLLTTLSSANASCDLEMANSKVCVQTSLLQTSLSLTAISTKGLAMGKYVASEEEEEESSSNDVNTNSSAGEGNSTNTKNTTAAGGEGAPEGKDNNDTTTADTELSELQRREEDVRMRQEVLKSREANDTRRDGILNAWEEDLAVREAKLKNDTYKFFRAKEEDLARREEEFAANTSAQSASASAAPTTQASAPATQGSNGSLAQRGQRSMIMSASPQAADTNVAPGVTAYAEQPAHSYNYGAPAMTSYAEPALTNYAAAKVQIAPYAAQGQTAYADPAASYQSVQAKGYQVAPGR